MATLNWQKQLAARHWLVACAVWFFCGTGAAKGMSQDGEDLSLKQFQAALQNPEFVVVDVRSSNEFNGWALGTTRRGGHVPGSITFDASWLKQGAENLAARIERVLHQKGIIPAKKIVVCSADPEERAQFLAYLNTKGFRQLFEFDLEEWFQNGGQLVCFPEYQRLLPATIVDQLLKGKRPASFENAKRFKFVEVSWGDEKASYLKGHVPGCFHVNTDHFEPPPSWYLGNSEVLGKFANRYGFQSDDTVIITGEDVTASYRLAIVLEYMGVADVRVLNGGLAAWKRAGFAVETERHDPPTAKNFGAKIPQSGSLIVTTAAVQKALAGNDEFSLIDTRTWDEFVGKSSGYSYHERKGRIPKSIYGQGNFRGSNSLVPYRNLDGTMRDPREIKAMWKKAGIDIDKELCFYCGGGWRAAEVWVFARVMGLEKSTLYSDGWIGWSNDPKNQVERGEPKQAGGLRNRE